MNNTVNFFDISDNENAFEATNFSEIYAKFKNTRFKIENKNILNFYMVMVISEGEGNFEINQTQIGAKEGTILIVKKGDNVQFEAEQKVKGVIFLFHEDFILKNLDDNSYVFLHQLFTYKYLQLKKSEIWFLCPFGDLIFSEQKNEDNTFKQSILRNHFLNFLLYIYRLSPKYVTNTSKTDFQNFIVFQKLLAQNFKENRNAEFYAKKMNISYKKLNQLCKVNISKTAKLFIDDFIIDEIKRELFNQNKDIKQISYDFGFNDPAHLSRYFKNIVGNTPKQFIKNKE